KSDAAAALGRAHPARPGPPSADGQLGRRDSAWTLRRSLREAMPEIFEAWERELQDGREHVTDG
ncbi:MAG: hypothetical protein J4N73_11515, partial [Chloroflexi bacterium]|nr:hypothetical protein [Chloroflexota bacterium]